MEDEVYEQIIKKKQFSEIPREDIEKAYNRFDRHEGEDRIKKTRWLLTNIFSGFGGKRIFNWKDKSPEEILQKHLSTRERFENYEEIYSRILKDLPKELTVFDFGCGVNGFSYNHFRKVGKEVYYIGVEALGQLVKLANYYFKTRGIESAMVLHYSLFHLEKIKKVVKQVRGVKVGFMFKVVDAVENLERNYTKTFLNELMPFFDRMIISFPTESWMRRKKFFAQRTWLIDFLRENYNFIDDFTLGGERYLVICNK